MQWARQRHATWPHYVAGLVTVGSCARTKCPVVDDGLGSEKNEAGSNMIAIVDDDEPLRQALRGLLRSVGLDSMLFSSAHEFLGSLHTSQIACLITDVQMPGMSGIELQAHLIARGLRIPIIFITAYGNPRIRAQALQAGAVEMLAKPFSDEQLLLCVRAVLAG